MPALSQSAAAMAAAVQSWVDSEVAPHVVDWDRDDVLPDSALEFLAAIGVPGALVPPHYGGPGLGVADMVDVWRALARGWISLTGAVNTTHLGTALLLRYGTESQRERWLPGIAAGEIWSSFSITEPQAGSDLHRLETSIEVPRRDPGVAASGEPGLWIDGAKRWVAGGGSFPLTFMLATDPEVGRPSCVVLPSEGRGGPGWRVEMLDKVGYRGVESAAWSFDHFHAAGAEILGGEDARGEGAHQMIDVLAIGRVNVACRALGIVDRAISCALDQATHREIGEGELGDYSHTQLRLGEMGVRQRTDEAIISAAAAAIDAGDDAAGEISTAAKVSASDDALWAVDAAARLAASRSYTWDAELARLRRDAPQTQIGEGANDSLLLATGKALIRSASEPPSDR